MLTWVGWRWFSVEIESLLCDALRFECFEYLSILKLLGIFNALEVSEIFNTVQVSRTFNTLTRSELIFLATATVSFGYIWSSLSILKIRDVCDTSKQFVEHCETDNFISIVSILVLSHRISHLSIISLLLRYVAYRILTIEKQKNTIYCRNLMLLFSQPNIINPNSKNLKIISTLLFNISLLLIKKKKNSKQPRNLNIQKSSRRSFSISRSRSLFNLSHVPLELRRPTISLGQIGLSYSNRPSTPEIHSTYVRVLLHG